MRKKGNVKKKEKTILEKQLHMQQRIIQAAEKEIYGNITQCLCLARIQLGNVQLDDQNKLTEAIGEASLLIGKAVKDLRNLAKQLSTG